MGSLPASRNRLLRLLRGKFHDVTKTEAGQRTPLRMRQPRIRQGHFRRQRCVLGCDEPSACFCTELESARRIDPPETVCTAPRRRVVQFPYEKTIKSDRFQDHTKRFLLFNGSRSKKRTWPSLPILTGFPSFQGLKRPDVLIKGSSLLQKQEKGNPFEKKYK